MKRSGQVGLMLMGVAAFAATYVSVAAVRAVPAPTGAQSVATGGQSAAQTCTARPDGTQNCEPARRGFTYYLIPHFVHGWWSGSSAKAQPAALAGNAPAPRAQSPALTYHSGAPPKAPALTSHSGAPPKVPALTSHSAAYTPAVSSSGAERGGFGTTAKSKSFRVSAGG